ncbi:SDK1 protein, partial [Polyodon spathula]|nr:SDK1 protein [Polyodon spathula]
AITLDNQLVVLSTAVADAGRYYVQAVNEKNGENKTSPSIYLSITMIQLNEKGETARKIAERLCLLKNTVWAIVDKHRRTGTTAISSRPVEKLNISWKRNGVRLTSGVGMFGRRLTIINPTSADVGQYVCHAALLDSSVPPVEARAFLSITASPYFTAEPKRKMMGEVEKTIDIQCRAMGVPVPSLEWYKDLVPLSKLANPRYKVMANGGLRIRGVRPKDAGIFQCFARNTAGEIQTHTYLDVTSMAPTFTQLPSDITVTDGTTAVFTCEVSGAPKPAIAWKKSNQILASGSVQIPRFTLLETGGLQVRPVYLQDAGNYSCYASNSEGAVNATISLTVWNRTFISHPPEGRRVIKGTMAVLECGATYDPRVSVRFVWKKDGVPLNNDRSSRLSIKDGSLQISQTWSGDIGDYTCEVLSQGGNDSKGARLEVIELPHSPRNLQASLNVSDSRTVGLSWVPPFDGNSPLLYYVVELSENNSPWKVNLPKVQADTSGAVVTGLTPARTYQFRVCAVNQVGKGQYSTETNRLMLPEEPPSAPPKNIVASGRTNQSIMVQWQPPPEPELNGVLRGYMLRYRLAGLPGEYQLKNITSPEINYCLVRDLIIWTQYEIQVAAYTGAGLGVFSHPVTEYTLQGVPTAPPQNVETKALTSTTVEFSWNPPPQQFINGINQGYKLLAWPEDSPDTVTIVTITPDFHGTRILGYITGLKKFSWYLTSVLCFTTPGDGPRSSQQLVQTFEDKPGAVGHLSFTEILDMSLRVSWQEPQEKNGIITGKAPRMRDFHGTRILGYITGLKKFTWYLTSVLCFTTPGDGPRSSQQLVQTFEDKLPGAPSNLIISNISPRSATLKFRAGDDGKTSISKWIVEGQVGGIGDDEEWRILYEKANDPDPQVLEIPDLTPFTHYRFRMRQVNIVGSSPASQPSRVIQTLQAPPDVSPSSVTVRTASETSLWLRWVPLPDSEYNGNPETVGYRISVWRADLQGEPRTQLVSERLEREITLEGLKEWTEYLLRIQAFNSIGPGPWSEVVRGRTRESVPSGAPQNVTTEAVSSTSILVTWVPVPEHERNGYILGFKVLYKEKDSGSDPQIHVVKGNLTQSVLLRNLRKYVLYEIQVLAFTRIGDGVPSSPPVLERSKDDVPGPPVRLVFPEVRLTSVRVVWQPPVDPNGIIMGYQIAYRLAAGDPNEFTTVEVGSNVRQLTVTSLKSESAYVFRISAKTQQGWGAPEQAAVITTERRDRPEPPKNLSITQSEVWSRGLLLRWVPGGDGSSPVRYFTVLTKELPDGEWQTHSSAISHNSTSWHVDRLKPFTSYKLRMMATNDIGDSEYSAETDTITTLQDVPDEPPVILAVTPHTTSSVLVQWQRPKEESLNGVLVGYRIYYRELQYESGQPKSKTTANPSALQVDRTAKSTFKTVNSALLTAFELTQLNKYKRYEIVMTAYNIIGESPTSAPVEVFVGEAAPSMAPQNIQVNPLTASQLEIQWDPPPVETQNGNIQGYKIYYWETGNYNETEKLKILFLPEATMRLKNLTSYTSYSVKISAFNAAGDGPQSEPRWGRTHQAAPSAPSYMTFSEVTTTTLNVSWGFPVWPNGVLEGYRVVYEPLAPIHVVNELWFSCPAGVSKVVTVEIKGNWQRWLKVRDLTKRVTYSFRVQAKTIAYGPELEANITAGPSVGSPGSPLEPSVTKSASTLTLHWSAGDPGTEPVTGYAIEARPSDEGLWDTFVKHLPPSTRSHTVSLDRLRQGVSYEFRVIAINKFGYGEPSVPSAVLSAQSENPFYEEWWFLIVMALCGLILILFIVFGLVLHGQSKKYKSCNLGKNISTVEESVTLDNGGFTSLELNSRHLNVKSSFLKKNGTRSPPRPSPGGLHYSDEDICNNYNGAVLTESTTLTEKPTEMSESESSLLFRQTTDSDYEDEQPKHSFVNHYMSDPTYYNSWKRQQKGMKQSSTYAYEECASGDAE